MSGAVFSGVMPSVIESKLVVSISSIEAGREPNMIMVILGNVLGLETRACHLTAG
jgi:hypothetical protein